MWSFWGSTSRTDASISVLMWLALMTFWSWSDLWHYHIGWCWSDYDTVVSSGVFHELVTRLPQFPGHLSKWKNIFRLKFHSAPFLPLFVFEQEVRPQASVCHVFTFQYKLQVTRQVKHLETSWLLTSVIELGDRTKVCLLERLNLQSVTFWPQK